MGPAQKVVNQEVRRVWIQLPTSRRLTHLHTECIREDILKFFKNVVDLTRSSEMLILLTWGGTTLMGDPMDSLWVMLSKTKSPRKTVLLAWIDPQNCPLTGGGQGIWLPAPPPECATGERCAQRRLFSLSLSLSHGKHDFEILCFIRTALFHRAGTQGDRHRMPPCIVLKCMVQLSCSSNAKLSIAALSQRQERDQDLQE